MFFNERLIGYLDTNDLSQSVNSDSSASLILNKTNFNANPKCYNCVLQQSACGLIELVCLKDVAHNEPLVCWFAEPYLKNIKSKIFLA